MALFDAAQLAFAKAVSELTYCNPFLPERIDGERKALGDDFIEVDPVWHRTAEGLKDNPNIGQLVEHVQAVVDAVRARLVESPRGSREELTLYEDLVLFLRSGARKPEARCAGHRARRAPRAAHRASLARSGSGPPP